MKLANVINRLGVKWLLIYLLLILAFAIVYWLLSDQFYHNTARYEYSLREEELIIRNAFSKAIQDNFLRLHPDKKVLNTSGVEYEVERLQCTRFSFSEGGILTIYLQLNLLESGGKALRINNMQLEVQHTVFAIDSNRDVFYTTLFIDCVDKKDMPDFEIATFLPRNSEKTFGASMDVDGYIHIDKALRDRYRALEDGWKGFPSEVKGTFGRMLYLSTVTITTLGSGDIVPISPLTRTIVGFESISGIIIIGLYLNALAKKVDSMEQNRFTSIQVRDTQRS